MSVGVYPGPFISLYKEGELPGRSYSPCPSSQEMKIPSLSIYWATPLPRSEDGVPRCCINGPEGGWYTPPDVADTPTTQKTEDKQEIAAQEEVEQEEKRDDTFVPHYQEKKETIDP